MKRWDWIKGSSYAYMPECGPIHNHQHKTAKIRRVHTGDFMSHVSFGI